MENKELLEIWSAIQELAEIQTRHERARLQTVNNECYGDHREENWQVSSELYDQLKRLSLRVELQISNIKLAEIK